MEVVILTGASRGLGAALADQLLSSERRLVCIARKPNPLLEQKARDRKAWLDYYLQDLTEIEASDMLAQSICDELPDDASRLTLINNAGMVEPVARASALPNDQLVRALNLNVAAAMLFSSRFLKGTEDFAGERRILNISSGAARSPYAGWSVYCATKAALDMFSRCVKLEEAVRPNPARIVSLAPGVVDTDMQATVRELDPEDFPNVERFRNLKATNQLASAEEAARRIVLYMARADFGTTEVDDVRNYSTSSEQPSS